jgi:hypothetical protein
MRVPTLVIGLVLGSVLAGFADDGPAATTTTLATSIPGAFTTRPPVFTATVEKRSPRLRRRGRSNSSPTAYRWVRRPSSLVTAIASP